MAGLADGLTRATQAAIDAEKDAARESARRAALEVGQRRQPAGADALRVCVAELDGVTVRDGEASGGDWITFEGYAAVFETTTTLYDSSWLRMDETIARGSFDSVLGREPLVHLNHGHDMQTAFASTAVRGVGELELEADFHGLRFRALGDPADVDVQRLAPKMRRRIVSQGSFAFTIGDEELVDYGERDGQWYEHWRILEIGNLYDVCVCAQGAYPTTESHLRSLEAIATVLDGRAAPGVRPRRSGRDAAEGASEVAEPPAPGSGGGSTSRVAALTLKARANVARQTLRGRTTG